MKWSEIIRRARQILRKNFPAVLACIIAFVTAYMMVLPAITLDEEAAGADQGIILETEEPADMPEDKGKDGEAEEDMAESSGETGGSEVSETNENEKTPDMPEGTGSAETAGPTENEESGKIAEGTFTYPVTLTEEQDDYRITVTFDSSSELPPDACLHVKEIKQDSAEYAKYCRKALKAVGRETGTEALLNYARFFDISFSAENKAIEPAGPVSVVIDYDRAIGKAEAEDLNVIHFDQDDREEPSLMEIETEVKNGGVDKISFESDSFSVYGVVGTYTVDFHYGEQDESSFSISGESSVLLSEVFRQIGYREHSSEEAEKAEFTDPELLKVEKTGNDWRITSLKPFHSDEYLTITFSDGAVLRILVTDDDGEVPHTLIVTLGNDARPVEERTDIQFSMSSTQYQELRINANFGDSVTASDKKITVTVPTGYWIKGYSATSSTAAISGVSRIPIDQAYEKYVTSSTLKGFADPNEPRVPITGFAANPNEGWKTQVSTASYAYGDGKENDLSEKYYAHGGTITYDLTDDASNVQFIVQIAADSRLLTHLAETVTMAPVDVQLSSSAGSVTKSMNAKTTEVGRISVIFPSGTNPYNFTGNAEDEFSNTFSITGRLGLQHRSQDGDSSKGRADRYEYTFTYPAGVYFTGQGKLTTIGSSKLISLPDGMTDGQRQHVEEFTIEEDPEGGGRIHIVMTDVSVHYHNGSAQPITLYFKARINDPENRGYTCYPASTRIPGLKLSSKVTIEDKTYTANLTATRNLMISSGEGGRRMMSLEAKPLTRRNLNREFGFTGDYAIGRYYVKSDLPYSNVTFYFENLQSPGESIVHITSMHLNGSNIKNIVVTTTGGRKIKVASIHTGTYGSYLSSTDLGLQEDEYIQSCMWTCSVAQGSDRTGNYIPNGISYNGHFTAGTHDGETTRTRLCILKEGSEEFSEENIMEPVGNRVTSVTQSTTAGYTNTQCLQGVTRVNNTKQKFSGTEHRTNFTPDETVYFNTYLTGGRDIQYSCTTIIDPTLIISLPEGITLDTTSVEAYSGDGSHGSSSFYLKQQGSVRHITDGDGRSWNVYEFVSPETGDMVARDNTMNKQSTIYARFAAHISPTFNNGEAYNLKMNDSVMWDIGKDPSAYYGTILTDKYDRAGKGTDYKLLGDRYKGSTTIKPMIGMAMDMSIRSELEDDFHTYYGTESSIALVRNGKLAYVKMDAMNTGASDYFTGTEMYIPIPKKGQEYPNYFENISPHSVSGYSAFGFTTYLQGPPELTQINGCSTDWEMSYAVPDGTVTENDPADSNTDLTGWSFLKGVAWKSQEEMTAQDYADVVMICLTAKSDIQQKTGVSMMLTLSIDQDAEVDQYDYWRSYAKTITSKDTGFGQITNSSVLAATPAMENVQGFIYIDQNRNGTFDEGDIPYNGSDITVALKSPGQDNRKFTNYDGLLRIMSGRNDVFLKKAAYTVEITDSSAGYAFEGIAEPVITYADVVNNVETSVHWGSDANPPLNGGQAGYSFNVENRTVKINRFAIALIPTVSTSLTVQKTLEGRTFADTDSFVFEISSEDGEAPLPSPATLVISGSGGGTEKTASSSGLSFYQPGSFTYRIRELGSDGNGITLDKETKEVTVTVSENQDGTLSASVSGNASFTNIYQVTPVTITLNGTKSMFNGNGGRVQPEADQFEFSITSENTTAPLPEEEQRTVRNDGEGKFSFSIPVAEAGTYDYVISEIQGDDGSIAYDSHPHTAKVVVTENKLTGTLSYNVTYDEDNDLTAVQFTNRKLTASIWLKKVNTKGEPLTGAVFTLAVRSEDNRYVVLDEWQEIRVDEQTGIRLTDLPQGDYELTELQAPDGYIIQNKKIYFTLNASGTGDLILRTADQEDFSDAGASVSGAAISVMNTPGAALPYTGGPGSLPFKAGGLALIMASALMYGFMMRHRERRGNRVL